MITTLSTMWKIKLAGADIRSVLSLALHLLQLLCRPWLAQDGREGVEVSGMYAGMYENVSEVLHYILFEFISEHLLSMGLTVCPTDSSYTANYLAGR